MISLNIFSVSTGIIGVFILGVISLAAFGRVRKLQWVLFSLATLYLLFLAYNLYGKWGGAPEAPEGMIFTLMNTHLGWLFFAFSTGVTFLISLFSLSYNDKKHATGIAPLWTILMAANTGIFFAADWITFIIAWELMGWTSFFIISHGREKSFQAGIYYYALSLIGASALLAGVFILHSITGTFAIRESIQSASALWSTRPGVLYAVALFFCTAFFTKSAIGPFYMWPAKAHAEAPDDFSAFLSGIMIKYGIFGLLIAVLPLFASYAGPAVKGTPIFLYILGWVGGLTAVLGTLLAVRENDMKRLMAFSTVSNVGFIVLALSTATVFGLAAGIFHTFNHMVFKAVIFLSMASVKFRTGERDMHRLGGIGYRMPIAFFAFLLGIIAAAGIPPMSGFASKWMVFQSLFDNKLLFLAIPAFFASTAAFMYLYRGLHSIYLGQLPPRFANIKAAPPVQMLVMLVLMLMVFAVGAFPGIVLMPVKAALGADSLAADFMKIEGITSSVNLSVVAGIFMFAFIGTLVLYIIGKPRKKVEPLDTYTSGEDPADWDMTPEQYHYAYRFYEPFEKMFNPILEALSFEKWFDGFRRHIVRTSESFGRWLHRPGSGAFVLTTALILILVMGIVVW